MTDNEELVLTFLREVNMNSNPDKWQTGFKAFQKWSTKPIEYPEFERALENLLLYYFRISLDYSNGCYNNFIVRK